MSVAVAITAVLDADDCGCALFLAGPKDEMMVCKGRKSAGCRNKEGW